MCYGFHLWMPETQVTSYRDYLFMALLDTNAELSGDLPFPAYFISL